jgi:DNA-binding transcriptional MocR family regulator
MTAASSPFRRHGAEVTGIPLEADGPQIDAFESALRKRVPKFFYIIADFQNPAGANLLESEAREDRGTRAAL